MVLCISYFVLMILHFATMPEVNYATESIDEDFDGSSVNSHEAGMIQISSL